jgi:hypothetical protein
VYRHPHKIIFLSLLIFTLCSDQKIIPDEKFVAVYVDLLVMHDSTSQDQFPIDSIKAIVFREHEITAKDYEHTIEHYNYSPEKWEDFFDKAAVYLEKLKQENVH